MCIAAASVVTTPSLRGTIDAPALDRVGVAAALSPATRPAPAAPTPAAPAELVAITVGPALRVNASVPAWAARGSSARREVGRFQDPLTQQWSPREGSLSEFRDIARSQDGEDVFAMETFFHSKQGGVVLESGALDGLQFSTSWLLVFGFGWYAVHIEPMPVNFRALTRGDDGGRYPGRIESLNINAALCLPGQLLHYAQKPVAEAVNGIWELMSVNYQSTWWPELYGKPELIAALPTIACSPLAPLLAAYDIAHVDLWVLDVEGAELQALRTVDWSRVRIDVLCIEVDFGSAELYQAVRDYLVFELDHLYRYHGRVGRNAWFYHKHFERLTPAAQLRA